MIPSVRWTEVRRITTVLGNLVLLLLFFALDIRDIYFKVAWLGPFDSYGFGAVGKMHINATYLSPVQLPTDALLERKPRESGWSSFLAKCDALQGSGFFLEVVGKNCSSSDPHNPAKIENLLMSSAVRVDSIAWSCCKLLHYHRRPSICQERMVTKFLSRYRYEDRRLHREAIAQIDSAAERELLQLLAVISRSAPTFRIICVQAFALKGTGEYRPTIYGCGNPSVNESAFAGHKATFLRELLRDRSWLTVDVLDVMGLRFTIRQNCKSIFTVLAVEGGAVTADHGTSINFSTSGQLYALVVAVDIFLAILHMLGALEIFNEILLPSFRRSISNRTTLEGQLRCDDHSCFSIFSRSLYRSRPVVLLTAFSQLVSWQIILPNAVVWTWTSAWKGKLVSYMSSIRVWVLLLLSLNALWDLIVFVHVKWALAFARRTFLTTFELMLIGASIAYVNRTDLFSMGEKKYAIQNQRFVDASSFSNGVGFSNSYDDDYNGIGMAHGRVTMDFRALEIVYEPLFRIVERSIAALFVYLIVKMVYLRNRHHRHERQVSVRAASQPDTPRMLSRHRLNGAPQTVEDQVPVEHLMGTPIRARSLVRSDFIMETERNGVVYVSAPVFFDFGVLLDPTSGVVRSRIGFVSGVIPPSIEVWAPAQSTVTSLFLTRAPGPEADDLPHWSFTSNPLARRKEFVQIRAVHIGEHSPSVNQ